MAGVSPPSLVFPSRAVVWSPPSLCSQAEPLFGLVTNNRSQAPASPFHKFCIFIYGNKFFRPGKYFFVSHFLTGMSYSFKNT